MNSINTIIIAAISSRIYVQAAIEARFEVIAIDAFADVDTLNIAKKVIQLDVVNGQFERELLLKSLTEIDIKQCIGFCYGAGFEAQTDLLEDIAKILPIIGNAATVVKACKNPQRFFALCDVLNIQYPATSFEKPNRTQGWLQKTIGGTGGAHIKPVLPLNLGLTQPVYYQKIQAGTPMSCLFLADSKQVQILGVNEQWCSPATLSPYRFGGAVSHAVLSDNVQHQLEEFVQAASLEWDLKGLNSCDFIVHNNELFMLELNPRLSATFDLYKAKRGHLFAAHVAAFTAQLNSGHKVAWPDNDWPVIEKKSRAMQIIYANQTAKIPMDMDWPNWVSDVPQPNRIILAGMPICTILAEARTAKLAKKKVLERAASL